MMLAANGVTFLVRGGVRCPRGTFAKSQESSQWNVGIAAARARASAGIGATKGATMPFSRRSLLPTALAVLAASTAPRMLRPPLPVSAGTAVLEFHRDVGKADTKPGDLVTTAKALDAALAKKDGHVATMRATAIDAADAMLRATVWQSLEAAENASLALDGDAAATAFAAACDATQHVAAHFRELRMHSYSDAACGHLEVVVFRTRPGVTREANLQKFDAAEKEFETGEGLLGHSLWIAPDGRWVHLLRWASAADYAKTGKALFGKPGVGGWIRSLDFQRFTVHRGDVAAK